MTMNPIHEGSHIEKVEKQTENPYLNLYHLKFHDKKNNDRDYYFCTRNKEEDLKIYTHELKPEGICVYAVTQEREPRLLLVHEYRFPVDEYIYSFPAGLIDPGESPGEAAVREVREETGFTFTEYTGGAAFMRRPFFLAPGFSDEPGSVVFGTVSDLYSAPMQEAGEWIEVLLADKKEIRRILSEEKTSVRAGLLMMNFLKSDPETPFVFLDC